MRQPCLLCASLLVLMVAAAPRAMALLTFNDGTDQVFVGATYTFGYDSNVFAQKNARGSSTQNYTLGANYTRRAGLISVTAGLNWEFGSFGSFSAQNFADPGYTVTFTKGTGRTTGALAFSAQKTDQPDPDSNSRAIAWNYSSSLNLRYPVNERYYFTNTTSYGDTLYLNKVLYANLGSISDGLNLNYVYDSKLDFSGGYNFGFSHTTTTSNYDHSLTVGASGSLLPKVTGSVSGGFEERHSIDSGLTSNYGSFTANGALAWRYSHLLSFAGSVNKGFSTSSTDVSLDTTGVSLNTDVNAIRRLRTGFVISCTKTDFLGIQGAGRRDTLWQFIANVGTAITTHIRANLAYAHTINYSNFSGAEFTGNSISLTLSADY